MSIVENNRKRLEELGEYVIRANASSGWFAVFPKKLAECSLRARDNARTDFHLVVYRTVGNDERDHWLIPFSSVSRDFTESTLTHSEINGSERWNCTFRGGLLRITHTERFIDCSQFHRSPLIFENSSPCVLLPEEVPEHEVFTEGSGTRVLVNRYERDAGARNRCIAFHGQACAICGFDFGVSYGPTMNRFIHVHHLIPLHQIRESYMVNPRTDLIPVCPNCHAVIHSRRDPLSVDAVRQILKQGNEDAP